MGHGFKAISLVTFAALTSTLAPSIHAAVVYYDRASFLSASGQSDTDDFSAYGSTLIMPLTLTNAEMYAVRQETKFQPLTTPDRNLVGDVFFRHGATEYCAGCNGNFRLIFDSTSLTSSGGVFGFAFDVLLHTSRRVSIGDDDPSNPTYPGGLLVEYGDGSTEQMWIPADVGYYDPASYFFGITDSRGIRSVTVGTTAPPHFWVIDNLTISAPPVPLPAAAWLLLSGLGGLGFMGRRRKAA